MNAHLSAENYFLRQSDCHPLCRIAQGFTGDGERHDPRCGVLAGVNIAWHRLVAQQAERERRTP